MKTLFLFFMLSAMYPGKREVLLFYNQQGTAMKEKQLSLLNDDKKGLSDRDLVIHVYNIADEKEAASKRNIKSTTPFTFLLIGKDGGEKLRSDNIVNKERLFSIIDAMPMRKDEMKKQR